MKMPRRIMIVQPYGIGDLLFITPVFRALKIGGAEKVDLVLGSRTESLVRTNPFIDEIFVVDKDHYRRQGRIKTFFEAARLGRALAARKYDLLLDYSLRGEYAFFSALFLGIRKRAGFDYKNRGFFHNIRIPLSSGFSGRHVVEYGCELAEKAGVRVEDRYLEFYPSPEDRKAAEKILSANHMRAGERFIVVSSGGGESWGKDAHFKRWPPRFFAELINELPRRFSFEKTILIGSPNEKELNAEVASLLKVPFVDLTGALSLGLSAAALEKASLFIGNDGGLMHLAHALRVPVTAFFGPVDPKVYGPYPPAENAAVIFKDGLECRPCYARFRYKSDCPTRDCLQALSPREALEKLDRTRFFSNLNKVPVYG